MNLLTNEDRTSDYIFKINGSSRWPTTQDTIYGFTPAVT